MARLLLVDDDAALRELLRAYLVSVGHEVRDCGAPSEAEAVVAAFRPELAVLDYEMPGQNGTALLAALRMLASGQELSAIFLSGNDPMRYAAQVPPDRRVRFMMKPVDLSLLAEAIVELLDPEGWSKPG